MRDDDDEGKPTQDSDRAAILARRKQFIALALSGLTTTAACTDGGETPDRKTTTQPAKEDPKLQPPQVCLSVSEPQVCLSVAPLPEPEPEPVPPQVCLKIAQPPEEPPEPQPKPEPSKPRPCLKKAAPQPCLKIIQD